MSGLLVKRAWFGSMALAGAVAMAACSDDGEDPAGAAGKGGGGSGGKAGSPSQGGDAGAGASSGGASAGSAGRGGAAPSDGGAGGGEEPGTAGEAGEAGSGGAAPSPLDELRSRFAGTSPLPAVPPDITNQYADDAQAAALGQRFFFDEKFSGAITVASDLGAVGDAQKVSCASCHSGPMLDDRRSNPPTVAIGTGIHTRNSPAVVNSAYYTWTNWGGRFSAQWELPLVVVENPAIMNGTRLALAHRIHDAYKADYEAVFGALPAELGTDPTRFPLAGKPKAPDAENGPWENMTDADRAVVMGILVNYSKALQAYMRKLVSGNAPFDAFMAGDDGALGASALKGAELFAGKGGCLECHNGPTFSDQQFHDLGVPQLGPNVPAADDGRFRDTPGLLASGANRNSVWSDARNTGKLEQIPNPLPDSWKGAFRTPSLRGVDLTAPYMHSGQLATLWDVLEFYDQGGTADTGAGVLLPLNLTNQEKAHLVDFLQSLTGEPVPAALVVDTAAP